MANETEKEVISDEEVQLISDQLSGNITGWLIDRLRSYECAYRYMTEDQQKTVINEATMAGGNLVRDVVRLIAGHGRETIPVKIKKVENDGEKIKVTIEGNNADENRHALFDAAGAFARIIVADAEKFIGGDQPEPEPDQRELDTGDREAA